MLPNETYPVKNSVEKNIAKSNKLNIGYKKINTPEPVATAFPPLKFAKIGKTCPIIANAPNIDKKSTLPSINVGRNVAIMGVTDEKDYPNGYLESGGFVIKAGEE